jgi:hypothetical protein
MRKTITVSNGRRELSRSPCSKAFSGAVLLILVLPFGALPQQLGATHFTSFRVKGAGSTAPTSINDDGVIAGIYEEGGTGSSYGFVRAADGSITKFHEPHGSRFRQR